MMASAAPNAAASGVAAGAEDGPHGVACPECLGAALTWRDRDLVCDGCGHAMTLIDDVLHTNAVHEAEALSALEVMSNMGKTRGTPSEALNQRWAKALETAWEALAAGRLDLDAPCPDSGLRTYFPARFSQYVALRQLLEGLPQPARILDVGAGEGMDACLVKRLFPQADIVALEFSPISARLGRTALPGATWAAGSACFMPFADESFDLVLACAAMHHMERLGDVQMEILRVLRPGGTVVTVNDRVRGDAVSDDEELGFFNAHPHVLRGVNERIPRASLMTNWLYGPDATQIEAFAADCSPWPKFASVREELALPLAPVAPGRFAGDSRLCANLHMRVRKLRTIDVPRLGRRAFHAQPLQAPPGDAGKPQAAAALLRAMPRLGRPLVFPGPAGNSRDALLNGWRARGFAQTGREAAYAARLFARRCGASETLLEIEVAFGASPAMAGRELVAWIDGAEVARRAATAGGRVVVAAPVGHIAEDAPFAIELALRPETDALAENLFTVERLALTAGPPPCPFCGSALGDDNRRTCKRCRTSDRNRALKHLLDGLQPLTAGLSCLNLSADKVTKARPYFGSITDSVYGGENHIDVQRIDLPDDSYDVTVCNHILEHVQDDRAAIAEILRITRLCVQITVPITSLALRGREYGAPDPRQHDHYRHYGADFPLRLREVCPDAVILACVVNDAFTGHFDVGYLLVKEEDFAARAFPALRAAGIATIAC